MRTRLPSLFLPVLLAAACAPAAPVEQLQEIDVAAAMGVPSADLVGVSRDPDDGALVVLDRTRGLYRLDASGGPAELLIGMDEIDPIGNGVRGQFTDVAALGGGRFAVTADADGFLLDLADGSLTLHFCYVPGWMPEEQTQTTHSLGYDPESGLLYAQPQTWSGSELMSAQIGTFDAQLGGDLDWFGLDTAEHAMGGLAPLGGGELLLGQDNALWRWAEGEPDLQLVGQLSALGVQQLSGLTHDPESGHIWLLDDATDRLVEVALQ